MRPTARFGAVVVLVLAGCVNAVDDVGGAAGDEESSSAEAVAEALTCSAADRAMLMTCYQRMLTGDVRELIITENITCRGSGSEACHLLFSSFTGPVTIRGQSSGTGGSISITRMDTFNYPIIDIRNSSRIEVRNIDFKEFGLNKTANHFGTPGYGVNMSCDQPLVNGESRGCRPTIDLREGSHDLYFDRITISESKGFPAAITLFNVTNVTLRRSAVTHSWANGMWTNTAVSGMGDDHIPYNLKVENSKFVDSRCSAMEVGAINGTYTGNYFSHNHHGSIYGVPGGQLNPMNKSRNIKITDNEFTKGRLDEDAWLAEKNWTSIGVEGAPYNVFGLLLQHNFIHDNPAGAFGHDPGVCPDDYPFWCGFDGVTISDNVMMNNEPAEKEFWNFPASTVLSGNCDGLACRRFVKSTGSISASPGNICTIDATHNSCPLTIQWSAQCTNGGTARVTYNDSPWAQGASGSQVGSISGLGRFDLYCGDYLINPLYVRGRSL